MRSRTGFALAAALIAIVLIAAMVTGALFATHQETSATAAEVIDQQAAAYAERSVLLTVAYWACAGCDAMQVGSVIVRSPATDPPLESTVYVTRLDSALFLVTAEGRIVSSSTVRARRRISVAVGTSRDSSGVSRAFRVSEQAWSSAYRM
jgi:hypothetical protein